MESFVLYMIINEAKIGFFKVSPSFIVKNRYVKVHGL